MKLSNEEVRTAEKHLARREKEIAAWPTRRWAVLIVFSVFAVLGARNVNRGLETIRSEICLDYGIRRAVEEPAPPGEEHLWAAGAMIKIAKILEIRQQQMNYALIEVALGVFLFFSGTGMICIVALRWSNADRDALICRVLRDKLSEVMSVDE